MKTLFEESGGTYSIQGDYNLPNVTIGEQPDVTLGRYAELHKKYLLSNHRVRYYNLLTEVKLVEYLYEVEQRALDMEDNLVRQMAENEGVTEKLKADDMLVWVRRMNNIRNRAREIVLHEVIYR